MGIALATCDNVLPKSVSLVKDSMDNDLMLKLPLLSEHFCLFSGGRSLLILESEKLFVFFTMKYFRILNNVGTAQKIIVFG